MTESTVLFVYGTLRRAYDRLPKTARLNNPPHVLQSSGKWQGEAKLHNYGMFDIGKYPGIVPAKDSVVMGDLFHVESSEDAMKILDEYEGIAQTFEEPYEYRRVEAEVFDEDGRAVKAWIYVYNWTVEGATRITSGDYVDYSKKRIMEHDTTACEPACEPACEMAN